MSTTTDTSAPTPEQEPTGQPSPQPSTSTTPMSSAEHSGTGSDIVLAGATVDARIRYAKAIAAAGNLLPRGLTTNVRPGDIEALAGRVFLIHETGSMLGIHPIAALQGVNVIEGKPTLSPALMTALIRRAGHRIRVTVDGTVGEGTLKAVARLWRADEPDEPYTCTWDLDRAERAGLVTVTRDERTGRTTLRARSSSGKVLPWEAYTEAMLKARATSEVCRDAAEDVLMGAHYTPEELGAIVDGEGEVVDVAPPTVRDEPADEWTEQGLADATLAKVLDATEVSALTALYASLNAVIARQSWRFNYPDLNAWTKTVRVEYPVVEGQTVDLTLLEAFGERKRAVERGGEAGGDDHGTRPTDEPDAPQDAPASPDPDRIDRNGPPSDHPAQEDPWQTPGPQSLDEHDAAIDRLAQGLGAEKVSDEAASPRDRVAAAHAAQVAQQERERPVDELGGGTPAAKGSGRAAMAAARAELDKKNEAKRAAQAAGARTGGKA